MAEDYRYTMIYGYTARDILLIRRALQRFDVKPKDLEQILAKRFATEALMEKVNG